MTAAGAAARPSQSCSCLLLLLLILVGVGIEPTFRVFQTRANPSQLPDLRNLRLKILDFRLLLKFAVQPAIRNLQSEINLAREPLFPGHHGHRACP